MKTCDHSVLYVLDFANQCIPLRPDGCLLCERDELQSKLQEQSKELARVDSLACNYAGKLKECEGRLDAAEKFPNDWHNPSDLLRINQLESRLDGALVRARRVYEHCEGDLDGMVLRLIETLEGPKPPCEHDWKPDPETETWQVCSKCRSCIQRES
jgi:hypothetical protein